MRSKFDNVAASFSRRPASSKSHILSDSIPRKIFLLRPSKYTKKSLARLRNNLCWNNKKKVFELKLWQRSGFFLRRPARSKFNFFKTQTLFQGWPSFLDPQINWISPWLGWKTIYVETINREFLSSSSDNVAASFFVDQLGQNSISFRLKLYSKAAPPS